MLCCSCASRPSAEGAGDRDSLCSLDGDRTVSLSDFFLFVRNFIKNLGSPKVVSLKAGRNAKAYLSAG